MATLSDLLTLKSDFNLFKITATLEPYKLQKIISLIDELLDYVDILQCIFQELVQSIDINPTVFTQRWYFEGRAKFYDIYRNVDSIDSLLLQIINMIDVNIETDPEIAKSDVVQKIDQLTECCLLLKQQYFISFKAKIDLSTEFEEFKNTLNSINSELENCLKLCFEIHKKKYTSPAKNTTTFNLETLTQKLFNQKSNLRLPFFNSVDKEIYEEYLRLRSMVDPLKASLEFIPPRIEEFEIKYLSQSDLIDIGTLEERHESLLKELAYLTGEIEDLKFELVDKKWNEIFSYLNTETGFMLESIERELKKLESLNEEDLCEETIKRIRYTCLTVQSTFDVLHIAIDEDLVDIGVMERSNELALSWLDMRNKIPHSYLEQEEDVNEARASTGQSQLEDDLLQNLKLLSLERNAVASERTDAASTPSRKHETMSNKEKRRSRAGEYFMGKLNIIPVLVEDDEKKSSPRNSLKNAQDSIFNRTPQLIQEGFQSKQKNQNSVNTLVEHMLKMDLQATENPPEEASTQRAEPDVNVRPELETPQSEKFIRIRNLSEEPDVFISPNLNNSIKPKELLGFRVPDSPESIIRRQRTLDTSTLESRPSRIPRPISKAAPIRQERPISGSIYSQLSQDLPFAQRRSLTDVHQPRSGLSLLRSVSSFDETPSRNGITRRSIIPTPSQFGPERTIPRSCTSLSLNHHDTTRIESDLPRHPAFSLNSSRPGSPMMGLRSEGSIGFQRSNSRPNSSMAGARPSASDNNFGFGPSGTNRSRVGSRLGERDHHSRPSSRTGSRINSMNGRESSPDSRSELRMNRF